MIHVVRHAHAGSRREWKGKDYIRPISGRGVLETDAVLARLNRPGKISAIFSSPLVRCVQTVEPLAEALDLKINKRDWLGVGADLREAERRLRKLRGHVVVCTHGELIGPLIRRLAEEDVPLDGDLRWPKGSIWHLKTKKQRFVSGRFEQPRIPSRD